MRPVVKTAARPRPRAWSLLPAAAVAAGVLLGAAPAQAAEATPAKRPGSGAAAAPAAVASAAAPDPLETLRLRLAERLTMARTVSDPAADVRVTHRGGRGGGPAPASPAASAGATRPATAAAKTVAHAEPAPARPSAKVAGAAVAAAAASGAKPAHAATASAPGAAHWGYAGAQGPASWGAIRPEFGLCATGQRQSPIDIRGGLSVDLEPVKFAYAPSRFGVVDNGHTVQVNVGAGNHIEVGGKRFELQQFHFHRPSEERIDGRQFEMSVHLVHKDEQGRLAVVTVLLDKGPERSGQPVVQKVWNNLPLERGEESSARVPLDLTELLPVDRRYYTYMGSLTTPPCSEGVQWIVMRQPVTVSAEQIELFAGIYPMNARPLQAAGGRRILQSN
jgi:carbonic anhydrase